METTAAAGSRSAETTATEIGTCWRFSERFCAVTTISDKRPSDGSSASACALACCDAQTSPMDSASRSEEHTSELQSLMRISYAVFCLKKKKKQTNKTTTDLQKACTNTIAIYN